MLIKFASTRDQVDWKLEIGVGVLVAVVFLGLMKNHYCTYPRLSHCVLGILGMVWSMRRI